MSHPHITPEQLQNGLQFQDEMMDRGFEKIRAIRSHVNGVCIDISDAREHFQHVHALIANTATHKRIVAEMELLRQLMAMFRSAYTVSTLQHDILNFLDSEYAFLISANNALTDQFTDLADKIFGTDKHLDNETNV